MLSGFELMWQSTYKTMTSENSHLIPPLSQEYPYYVFVESLGTKPAEDYSRLEDLIGEALETELIQDAVMAQSERENYIPSGRFEEDVSVLAAQANFDQHFDISIPIPLIGKMVDDAVEALEKLPFVSCVCFHLVM